MKIELTEIQRFCTHDGPGIRTTVFLKGCPLHCFWCHNPETATAFKAPLFYQGRCIGCGACEAVCPVGAHRLSDEGGAFIHEFDRERCTVCGACSEACPAKALTPVSQWTDTDVVIEKVLKDRAFYGEEGGLTLSGGEPLFQPEGALELLRKAKEAGLSTAVETCGLFPAKYLPELVSLTDVFLWDLKDTDPERFEKNCGAPLEPILRNLREADERGARLWVRGILVAGHNTKEEHYRRFAEITRSLRHCEKASFFAYHAFSGSKMLPLGLPDNGDVTLIPSEQEMERAASFLKH